MSSVVYSMTGFSSVEGDAGGQKFRIECKSLNHRFLDVKIRLPRDLASAEMAFRALVQTKFSRGSLDIKVERIADQQSSTDDSVPALTTDLKLAQQYYNSLLSIQKNLGLKDEIKTRDIAVFNDVITRANPEAKLEEAWARLEPLAGQALTKLQEMRAHEGETLKKVFHTNLRDMNASISELRTKRSKSQAGYPQKIKDKIKAVFEAYPLTEGSIQAVLESRLSQELALIADRTDVEEELVRFKGHLDHFEKTLNGGGQLGRKLDFILQELSREINTLGNKAQDFSIGEDVVQVKVRLEQIREQVMNLE